MEDQLIGIRAGMHAEVELEVLHGAAFRKGLRRLAPSKPTTPMTWSGKFVVLCKLLILRFSLVLLTLNGVLSRPM